MKKMIKHLKDIFGGAAAKAAEEAMLELLLPIPADDEYYLNENGSLTFLTQLGAVVRFNDAYNVPIVRHPYLLRPIGAIAVTKSLRLDIQPAGKTLVSSHAALKAREALRKSGIWIVDNMPHNFIASTHTNDEFPNGIPWNFDPHEIHFKGTDAQTCEGLVEGSKRILDLSPESGEETDVQDDDYGALVSAFKNAHDLETDALDPEKVLAFWTQMRQAVKDGMLIPGWEHHEETRDFHNSGAALAASQLYNRRLASSESALSALVAA